MVREKLILALEDQIVVEEGLTENLGREGALDALYLMVHYLSAVDSLGGGAPSASRDPGMPVLIDLTPDFKYPEKLVYAMAESLLVSTQKASQYVEYYEGYLTGLRYFIELYERLERK